MFAPVIPKTERSRIRTEREYREWQLTLRGIVPVRHLKNEPGFFTRLANTLHRVMTREAHSRAAARYAEQETLDFANSKHLS